MKRLFIVALILLFSSVRAQNDEEVKIFHRLVILNSDNELMVVKIENAEVWVTPGFYQTPDLTIKKGLIDLALAYGIEIDEPKLKGVFILKRELDNAYSTSLRNIFVGHSKSDSQKIPNGIEEVKWVTTEEAMQLITFPHISVMIQQINEQA